MTGPQLRNVIGQNVRARRSELGLTQEDLADAAHIAQAHVSDIERGKTWISEESLVRIADALRTQPHLLFDPNAFCPVSA